MGVGLSCLVRQSSAKENRMKPASSKTETTCGRSCSVLHFLKLGCFSGRDHPAAGCSSSVKRYSHHDEEMKMKMQRSLGEWLADPSPTSGRTTFGSSMESFIFMSFSKKVHPSSSVNPRNSFSKEKVMKDEEVKRGEDGGLGSHRQKGKKVRFRLPEENEIISFLPSPEFEEERDES